MKKIYYCLVIFSFIIAYRIIFAQHFFAQDCAFWFCGEQHINPPSCDPAGFPESGMTCSFGCPAGYCSNDEVCNCNCNPVSQGCAVLGCGDTEKRMSIRSLEEYTVFEDVKSTKSLARSPGLSRWV